uniref:EthD domain-containing protein n=1 Tax=Moniliophthora roreri TaxID=221103 RepID=A0A0W0FJ48_MONRR
MPAQHALRTDRIRTLIFLRKKSSISYEEFDQYWLQVHSKVFANYVEGKRGILKYEQMHINLAEKAKLKGLGLAVLEGYDGVALFDLNSFDDSSALWSTDEYFSVVLPDEEKFIDRATSLVFRFDLATIVDSVAIPSYDIRKDTARMLVLVARREGRSMAEFTESVLSEHARILCEDTQMGMEITKYEQLHLAFPLEPIKTLDELSSVPREWDEVEIIDACSYDPLFRLHKTFANDSAALGGTYLLPVNVATIIDKDAHYSV